MGAVIAVKLTEDKFFCFGCEEWYSRTDTNGGKPTIQELICKEVGEMTAVDPDFFFFEVSEWDKRQPVNVRKCNYCENYHPLPYRSDEWDEEIRLLTEGTTVFECEQDGIQYFSRPEAESCCAD